MTPTEEMYNTLLDLKATEEEKTDVKFKVLYPNIKFGKITGFIKKNGN